RTQSHGDGGELPEVVHVVRVRVGGQAAAAGRAGKLLAEPIEVVLAQAALQVGAGVHAGGGVALEVDLVPAAGVVLAAEEVVQAHLVQGGHRGVGGNVPADGDLGFLRPGDHHGGVPPQVGAVAALHRLVTGEVRLVLPGDAVHVRGGQLGRSPHLALPRTAQQVHQDVASAGSAAVVDQPFERFDPFTGFIRVDVRHLAEQSVDQWPGFIA